MIILQLCLSKKKELYYLKNIYLLIRTIILNKSYESLFLFEDYYKINLKSLELFINKNLYVIRKNFYIEPKYRLFWRTEIFIL